MELGLLSPQQKNADINSQSQTNGTRLATHESTIRSDLPESLPAAERNDAEDEPIPINQTDQVDHQVHHLLAAQQGRLRQKKEQETTGGKEQVGSQPGEEILLQDV